MSLTCKVILKVGITVQPIIVVLDREINIEKLDSASENPVTHQGFKLEKTVIGFKSFSISWWFLFKFSWGTKEFSFIKLKFWISKLSKKNNNIINNKKLCPF